MIHFNQNNSWKSVHFNGHNIIGVYNSLGKVWPEESPVFGGKWLATYADSHTASAECDSTSAITNNEIRSQLDVVSVEIGQCVTSIGQRAFEYFRSISTIDIPNSVTSIGEEAFFLCTGLTSISLSNNLLTIGKSAFMACSALTSVTIPNSVTSIGVGAFNDCSGLTSCTLGTSVTSIGGAAFYGCSSLTSIEIPDNVTSIGDSAFLKCSGLTSVTIGTGVTSIGYGGFFNCNSLTAITCNAITPPTLGSDGGAFSDTNNCPIYVPAASVETYKAASGWSDYASRIQPLP